MVFISTEGIPLYLIKAWVQEYTLGDMSIPWALVTGTGYIHEPIPLKLGYKYMYCIQWKGVYVYVWN